MKFAIIGYGSIGSRHLENLINLGEEDIVIVSSHLMTSEIDVCGKTVNVVDNINLVLDSVDIMIITNETNLHLKYLKIAINQGIHAYVEKPLSSESNELDYILKKAKEKKLIIALGTQFKFNELLIKLKKLIDENYFGRIISVMSSHGEHIADYHPNEDFKLSYSANKNQGGGILLTQIHHLDYLDWLFGPFSHAYANEMKSPALEIDVESVVNYSLVSARTSLQVHGHMNYFQRPKSTTLSIIGETGSAFWNYEDNSMKLFKNSNFEEEISNSKRNQMFILSMKNFIESVREIKIPKSDITDGIRVLRIVESIKKSILTKQVQKIN